MATGKKEVKQKTSISHLSNNKSVVQTQADFLDTEISQFLDYSDDLHGIVTHSVELMYIANEISNATQFFT